MLVYHTIKLQRLSCRIEVIYFKMCLRAVYKIFTKGIFNSTWMLRHAMILTNLKVRLIHDTLFCEKYIMAQGTGNTN